MSKLAFAIRPAEQKDVKALNYLRRHPKIVEATLALPSESLGQNEAFLLKQENSYDDHFFCAETEEKEGRKVIGFASLHVSNKLRQRHSAELGIMVDPGYHGQGVGNALMETLIDLADNWLMLVRIELTVFMDNEAAIHLYEKFRFVKEGVLKFGAIRQGRYEDLCLMARYREHP